MADPVMNALHRNLVQAEASGNTVLAERIRARIALLTPQPVRAEQAPRPRGRPRKIVAPPAADMPEPQAVEPEPLPPEPQAVDEATAQTTLDEEAF